MAASLSILRSYVSPFLKNSTVDLNNRKTSAYHRRKYEIRKSNSIKAVEQPFTGPNIVYNKTQNLPSVPLFQFNDYMSLKLKQVNKSLEEMASVQLQQETEIQKAMRYSLLSTGKRVRPILCLAACDIVGGDESVAMPTACAIEMIHAMSLMFDDLPCLDNDDMRRGIPSNHKVFGEEGTILAGTSLTFLAFQLVVDTTKDVTPDRVLRSISEIASSAGFDGLQGGQLLDVRSEGKQTSLDELDRINSMKASKLFEASVVCGAILGGGNELEIEKLRKYAIHAGLCLQVVDDIMDMNESYEKEGKCTYPDLIGIDGAKKFIEEQEAQAMEELSHFEEAKAAPLYHMVNCLTKLIN